MGGLREKERDAVVLRYFEGKSLGEVGAVLIVSGRTSREPITTDAAPDASSSRIPKFVGKDRDRSRPSFSSSHAQMYNQG